MSDSTSRTPSVAAALPTHPHPPGSGLSKSPSEAGVNVLGLEQTVIAQSPIAGPGEFYPTGTVASLAKVLIGKQLDHFELRELIGGGGMGAVFRAYDMRLDREVAVKVIPNLGRDLEALRRFRVEAQSAARLDHPHIARVYYVGETEAWSYIVFEFVEGINLRDLVVRQGPLSIDDAVYYTCQVAEALQHATDRWVVHRDIKPSNVLVTSDGMVKVVDMGLARTTALDRSTNDLTASGVTLGTFDYISPEQARDPRAADVRSDLYSLGCTLYYFLTGHPPYPEGTAMQKLLMHGSVPAEDPRQFRNDVSADLTAIIRKLMAKKPADRYLQPVDLIADLQRLADLEDLTKSQQAVGLVVAPARFERSLFEMVAPWMVGILAIVGSTWFLHAQHAASARYEIPREIESTVAIESSFGSREASSGQSNLTDATLTIPIDKVTRFDKSIDFLSPDHVGSGSLNDEIGKPSLLDAFSLSNSDPDPNSSSDRSNSTARILWVRPFESSESASDQGLEYRVMTGNLSDALVAANAEPNIEELWLDDDVWIVDKTLDLQRDSLVIRSAPDRKARIELRIPRQMIGAFDANSSTEKLFAFDIGSNQLVLDDLDLFLTPPDSGSGDIGLIGMGAGGSIRLMHTTITLAANGTSWNAHGFGAIDGSALSPTAGRPVQDPLRIEMEDVVFRGEGDLVNLESARRTELHWRNGLLAVSGRMFELGGARDASRTPPTIRVDVEQVTIAAQHGLARIRLTKEHPFPVCLSRESINCTYTSDPSFPVVAIENVDFDKVSEGQWSSFNLATWLDLRGRDNAYDEQIDMLVKWTSPQGTVSRIGFESASRDYFSERAPETNVRWLISRPIVKPFELHTAGDYLQREGGFRPGFRPELLPNH